MEDIQSKVLFASNEIAINNTKLNTLNAHGNLPFCEILLNGSEGDYKISLKPSEKQDVINFLKSYFENKNKEKLNEIKELLS